MIHAEGTTGRGRHARCLGLIAAAALIAGCEPPMSAPPQPIAKTPTPAATSAIPPIPVDHPAYIKDTPAEALVYMQEVLDRHQLVRVPRLIEMLGAEPARAYLSQVAARAPHMVFDGEHRFVQIHPITEQHGNTSDGLWVDDLYDHRQPKLMNTPYPGYAIDAIEITEDAVLVTMHIEADRDTKTIEGGGESFTETLDWPMDETMAFDSLIPSWHRTNEQMRSLYAGIMRDHDMEILLDYDRYEPHFAWNGLARTAFIIRDQAAIAIVDYIPYRPSHTTWKPPLAEKLHQVRFDDAGELIATTADGVEYVVAWGSAMN